MTEIGGLRGADQAGAHAEAFGEALRGVSTFASTFPRTEVEAPALVSIYGDAGRTRAFTDDRGAGYAEGSRLDVVVLSSSGGSRLVLIREIGETPRHAVGWVRASDLGLD
jgi:hypothetical protein